MVKDVEVYDPLADPTEAKEEYGIELSGKMPKGLFDAIVLAVRHDQFCQLGSQQLRAMLRPDGVIYDLKRVLPPADSDGRL
jgi:UDP-N-acetyl-D-galactosamine dehydrogenase